MTPDVVCLGILVADVIARPVDELPATGSLGLVETILGGLKAHQSGEIGR